MDKRTFANWKKSGVSAKAIIIPAVIVILLLHAGIIINTIRINRAGQQISRTTQGNFTYTELAKNYQNSSDLLADKARLYVSTCDISYLSDYTTLLDSIARQSTALTESVASRGNEVAAEQVQSAFQITERRIQMEYRAMRLCADAVRLDLSDYPKIAGINLSAEENEMSPMEKLQAAGDLLVSTEYLQSKNQISDHIDRSIQAVSTEITEQMAAESATLRHYQILQWIMTLTIILLLSIMCVLLFVLLLGPLERSADEVQRGETIDPDRGLQEFRRLAFAYNELLHHRKMMESYLRQQSQTDALTGLPNRLAFQNYISELSWEKAHSSVIVFSLDVNGLKETNDTNGHTFGDALLRNCAACIKEALGEGPGKQCFRFGGDEFAAFWVDVPLTELDEALKKFEKAQASRDVSISVGCAYAQDLSETTVDALFQEADKHMYDDKAEFHRRQAQEVLDQLKLM